MNVPKINNVGAQIRANALVRRIVEEDFDPATSERLINEAMVVWGEGPNAVNSQLRGNMLHIVQDSIRGHFANRALPLEIQSVFDRSNTKFEARQMAPAQAYAAAPPSPVNASLAADMSTLSLSRAPSSATGPRAGAAGPVAPVGGMYVPSERAQRLLAHYKDTKDDYAPMAKRRARLIVQEQEAGTSEWQDTMDALYVVSSIILDQRDGKGGLMLKYFNGDDDHEITSVTDLLKKMNSNKTRPTKIPAFSDNFQTALWDYLRDYDDRKGSRTKIEQESIYLICTGADNDSSENELKEAVEELKKMKLPPKQLCAAAIRIGNDAKGEAKLAALDDPSDASMRDIFDAPVFSEVDPRDMVKLVFDAHGNEVERDSLQKMMMGLFNKDLD